MTAFQRLRGDERGISLVLVAVGMMGFLGAASLAIDVGMFMTARSQAQNSADAGALAGAVALVFNDYDDRSTSGPAVQSALNTARANAVMHATVSVAPADVTFPLGPTGLNDRVQVTVYRTSGRANAIPTLMGALLGVRTVDMIATAIAEASLANAETCVKPFTIPDKWLEKQDPGGWSTSSTFDMYDNKGKLLANPDVYIGPDDPNNYTGYNAERDKGLELVLKANNTTKITSSFYNPYDLPGSVGASDYRNNIGGCNPAKIHINDDLPPENGNMVGPTQQGTQALVDRDPNARWDTSCNCVKDSAFGSYSPRIVIIPVYNPIVFANGPAHGKNIDLQFTNFIGFFIEPMNGNQVMGRIVPVTGLIDGNAGPAPPGAFPRVIRLVQ
jgi:Flp pilus assembly protein TadG